MELEQCLKECEKMISKGSSSFYKAFRLLPSPRREAVYVIYAFCRLIDDSVDEERPIFTIDELDDGFRHLESASGHFIWTSLRWLFAQFPLSKGPFQRQIVGQRLDLTFNRYETQAQLEHYCYLVAGTVGEMLLPVLHDSPTDKVIESGVYLGKAMQIVNVIRDVGEDRDRGRRYLPQELLDKHGYSERDFAEGQVNGAFRAIVDELGALAGKWFELGMRDLDTYSVQSAISVELAAKYYAAIFDKVIAMNYQVYTKRAIVGPLDKGAIYLSVMKKHASEADLPESSAVS